MPDWVAFDDVAFHEGNVPAELQLELRQQVPRLRFEDARAHGGFPEGARSLLPPLRDKSEHLDYPIGYRHMVGGALVLPLSHATALPR
eukprot:3322021-Prymnesium_polylepis.1